MNPDGIMVDFLVDVRNVFPDDLNTSGDDVDFTVDLNELLSELEGFSLISRLGGEMVRIHRLVQSVFKDSLSDENTGVFLTCICQIAITAYSKARLRKPVEYVSQLWYIVVEAFQSYEKRPLGVYLNVLDSLGTILDLVTHELELVVEIHNQVSIRLSLKEFTDICTFFWSGVSGRAP
jgi:hypothetical protein